VNKITSFVMSSARAAGSVVVAGGAALLAAGTASATVVSDITDKITANGADAVLIVGAFIVAVWAIKSMGLFKKG
jgi:hypothetical protein